VLAAVRQDWQALEWASAPCRSARPIVVAGVAQDSMALKWAEDELLEDETFAVEAKLDFFILKITLLSGRTTFVASPVELRELREAVLPRCCQRLGMARGGHEVLVNGADCVPVGARVPAWPGIQPSGKITEYQLIIGAAANGE